jgi:hypothetical protein
VARRAVSWPQLSGGLAGSGGLPVHAIENVFY